MPDVLRESPSGPPFTGQLGGSCPSHSPFVDLDILAGAVEIDLSDASVFRLILDANVTTVTMANVTTGEANFFTLEIAQDAVGSRTFAPPASWKYSTGAYAPSSAANAVDLLNGISFDNGVTWLVSYLRNYI
jgi:hypothetical protein